MQRNEQMLQEAIFRWAKLQTVIYPELELLHHIPNGGRRNLFEAFKLKRMGVKAGIPDIHLPVSCGKYNSLWIELKSHKGKTTENQLKMLKLLSDYGNFVCVIHDVESAICTIKAYLEKDFIALQKKTLDNILK
jgi:hypothetical protein